MKVDERVSHTWHGPGTVVDLMFEEQRSLLAGVIWSQLIMVSVCFDDGITCWFDPVQLTILVGR